LSTNNVINAFKINKLVVDLQILARTCLLENDLYICG
jgi:hypothetical protein